MVHKCFICQKSWNKSDTRSFHRFPREIKQRNIWLQNFGICEEDILKVKDAKVCSDHFSSEDVCEYGSGRFYLKFNAIPKSVAKDIVQNSMQTTKAHSSSSTLTASSFEHSVGESPHSKKRKCNQLRYIGDCHSSDMLNPTRAKKVLKLAKTVVKNQRRKISNLQRQTQRLKSKVTSLKSLLTHLRENQYISSSAESVIEATLPGSVADIMRRIVKGPTHAQYSPALRTFALTLNFYSAKAYNYVRETFNGSLPHPRTLTKWYSKIDGKPGFTEESLRAIKAKVDVADKKKICVNLVLDEMHIMRKVEWTGKEVIGYINLGTKLESDCVPEASQALVFMVVAMNDLWKIPVGYFFIESLTGTEKANLLMECLRFLSAADVKVTSVTFDGAAANITMMKALGANLDNPSSMTTYFLHPVTQEKVFFFLDPCHMLKLVRNAFGTAGNILLDHLNREVKWRYIEKLVEIQEKEGLLAGTKLRPRHLKWFQEKMRVKIAAQILSKSVADALIFLETDAKNPEFAGSEATSQFILLFNNIFDIFNSKNFFAKYKYKEPLSEKNWQNVCQYFHYTSSYILNLKLNNQPVVESGRKIGFLGFLICIESLKGLFWDCVVINPTLSFILTYKLSQDHLELFFSAIRNRCGFNNNPTCRMFEIAYKKLLIHTEVKSSKTANALALDGTTILDCSSNVTKNIDGELQVSDEYIEFTNEFRDHDYLCIYFLSEYIQDVVAYIAGFVVKSLSKKIKCKQCVALLEGDCPLSKLQARKTYGKLRKASKFVVKICSEAERCIKLLMVTKPQFYLVQTENLKNKLINTCLRYLPQNIFEIFEKHIFDLEPLNDHWLIVTKFILDKYIDVRLHHEYYKMQNLDRRPRLRSLLTKSILFQNQ